MNQNLIDEIEECIDAYIGNRRSFTRAELERDYERSLRLREAIPTKEALDAFSAKAGYEIEDWLTDFPQTLAQQGMSDEAAAFLLSWSEVLERPMLLGDRACILAQAGRRDEALKQVEQLIHEYPDDGWTVMRIAAAYDALQDPESAEVHLRRAYTMTNDDDIFYDAGEELAEHVEARGDTDEAGAIRRRIELLRELCEKIFDSSYLTRSEIDAILANREFFQPYLRRSAAEWVALPRTTHPLDDNTDLHGIFLLTEMNDSDFIPDLLAALRRDQSELDGSLGDTITEHLWLVFARLGNGYLDAIMDFVCEDSISIYIRGAAVRGVISMHHFHPDMRAESVAFIERLLEQTDAFPEDHLAGFLCDCADEGLMEMEERAVSFAREMKTMPSFIMPMATSQDVMKAFRSNIRKDDVARVRNVYDVNAEWESWSRSRDSSTTEDAWEDQDGDDTEYLYRPSADRQGPYVAAEPKIGRNDPCPCGSGKKYKKCHGA